MAKRTVRILIADDHPIVGHSLKKLFLLESDLEVVGEARNGRETMEKVESRSRLAAARCACRTAVVCLCWRCTGQQTHAGDRTDGVRG